MRNVILCWLKPIFNWSLAACMCLCDHFAIWFFTKRRCRLTLQPVNVCLINSSPFGNFSIACKITNRRNETHIFDVNKLPHKRRHRRFISIIWAVEYSFCILAGGAAAKRERQSIDKRTNKLCLALCAMDAPKHRK